MDSLALVADQTRASASRPANEADLMHSVNSDAIRGALLASSVAIRTVLLPNVCTPDDICEYASRMRLSNMTTVREVDLFPVAYIHRAWRAEMDHFLSAPGAGSLKRAARGDHAPSAAAAASSTMCDAFNACASSLSWWTGRVIARPGEARLAPAALTPSERHSVVTQLVAHDVFVLAVVVFSRVAPSLLLDASPADVIRNCVEVVFPDMPASLGAPAWVASLLCSWADQSPGCGAVCSDLLVCNGDSVANGPSEATRQLFSEAATAIRALFLYESESTYLVACAHDHDEYKYFVPDTTVADAAMRINLDSPTSLVDKAGVVPLQCVLDVGIPVLAAAARDASRFIALVASAVSLERAASFSGVLAMLSVVEEAVSTSSVEWDAHRDAARATEQLDLRLFNLAASATADLGRGASRAPADADTRITLGPWLEAALSDAAGARHAACVARRRQTDCRCLAGSLSGMLPCLERCLVEVERARMAFAASAACAVTTVVTTDLPAARVRACESAVRLLSGRVATFLASCDQAAGDDSFVGVADLASVVHKTATGDPENAADSGGVVTTARKALLDASHYADFAYRHTSFHHRGEDAYAALEKDATRLCANVRALLTVDHAAPPPSTDGKCGPLGRVAVAMSNRGFIIDLMRKLRAASPILERAFALCPASPVADTNQGELDAVTRRVAAIAAHLGGRQ